jgi:NADH dehydrogenase (ubiquinone) 1 alpha/beta subcomplex 1
MWRLIRFSRRFSSSELEYRISEILKRFNTVDPSKITSSATFKDIGLDSLDSVEAVVAMEEILNVELTDEEAFKVTSIQEAVSTFSKHLKV